MNKQTANWALQSFDYSIRPGKSERLRIGTIEARPGAAFCGNVIYFQGLGDSMLNHDPLFLALSAAGFRVLAFDYPGQGGSSGSMNQTTTAHINAIGDLVWKKLARLDGPPATRKMNIIGWSTGGLAAYRKACHHPEDVASVVLIAPGIVLNVMVGEGLRSFPPNRISMRTLTTATAYARNRDPHIDPIKPDSPLKVPRFSINLLRDSLRARTLWKIDPSVRGYVALSGDADTYVNADKTMTVLARNAPHFEIRRFPGALHEIDNESPTIADAFRADVIEFLRARE